MNLFQASLGADLGKRRTSNEISHQIQTTLDDLSTNAILKGFRFGGIQLPRNDALIWHCSVQWQRSEKGGEE
jgi:hypothetical protein